MAKAPKTDHARAIAAFLAGNITREDYKACVRGQAVISGRAIFDWVLYSRPKMRMFSGIKNDR